MYWILSAFYVEAAGRPGGPLVLQIMFEMIVPLTPGLVPFTADITGDP